ncbi:MAG: hypothetical protein WB818_13580, partial [Desulfobacterales bacterium]
GVLVSHNKFREGWSSVGPIFPVCEVMELNMLDSLFLQVRMIYLTSGKSCVLAAAIRLDVQGIESFAA